MVINVMYVRWVWRWYMVWYDKKLTRRYYYSTMLFIVHRRRNLRRLHQEHPHHQGHRHCRTPKYKMKSNKKRKKILINERVQRSQKWCNHIVTSLTFRMMGLATCSTSFCLPENSSVSASGFSSIQSNVSSINEMSSFFSASSILSEMPCGCGSSYNVFIHENRCVNTMQGKLWMVDVFGSWFNVIEKRVCYLLLVL